MKRGPENRSVINVIRRPPRNTVFSVKPVQFLYLWYFNGHFNGHFKLSRSFLTKGIKLLSPLVLPMRQEEQLFPFQTLRQ
jgi:hypothetical protein